MVKTYIILHVEKRNAPRLKNLHKIRLQFILAQYLELETNMSLHLKKN
jgi:hypothetical protein